MKNTLKDVFFSKGKITIRHFRNGKELRVWQEYRILHFLRKLYGWNIPKIFGLTGYFRFGATYANLVPTAGKGLISGRISGVGSPAAPSYMAIGTGTTAAAAGDTALETEITDGGGARGSATVTLVTTTVTNDTVQSVKSWTFTLAKNVSEMGLLNDATTGTLEVRNVFTAYPMQIGDTLEITHKLKNA